MTESEIFANGVSIATYAGGNGSTPLFISFTTNMARVQAFLGLVGFSNTSEAPLTTPRVLSVQIADATGAPSATRCANGYRDSDNDVPVLTLPTSSILYTENDPSLSVFTDATAVDPDLSDSARDDGVLTVTNTNGESTDRLVVKPSGVYSIVGTNLRANGINIATLQLVRYQPIGLDLYNHDGSYPSSSRVDWFFEHFQ